MWDESGQSWGRRRAPVLHIRRQAINFCAISQLRSEQVGSFPVFDVDFFPIVTGLHGETPRPTEEEAVVTTWIVLAIGLGVIGVLVVRSVMARRPVRARDLGSVSRQWMSEHISE